MRTDTSVLRPMAKIWDTVAPEMARPAAAARSSRRRRPKPQFKFGVTRNEIGNRALSVGLMSLSDIHLWKRPELEYLWKPLKIRPGPWHSRSKKVAHMFENIVARKTKAPGDIVDREHVLQNAEMGLSAWDQQVLAHLFRREATVFGGNHEIVDKNDIFLRWIGKQIFGISIVHQELVRDSRGRVILIKHGQDFDDMALGPEKDALYIKGDKYHRPVERVEIVIQGIPYCDSFSLSSFGKSLIASPVGKFLPGVEIAVAVDNVVTSFVDTNPDIDGLLFGHTHRWQVRMTPGGKLVLNGGNSSDGNPSGILLDENERTWAFARMYRDRVYLKEENGSEHVEYLKHYGIKPPQDGPAMIEDEATKRADRAIRILQRATPSLERQQAFAERHRARREGREPPPLPEYIRLHPHSHHGDERRRIIIDAYLEKCETQRRQLDKGLIRLERNLARTSSMSENLHHDSQIVELVA